MNIQALEITYPLPEGKSFSIYPSVVIQHDEIGLIDCGYEGSLPLIKTQMRRQGTDPASVTRIIISHDDIDHVGGLKEWKDEYPAVPVYCSAVEAPRVSGEKKS